MPTLKLLDELSDVAGAALQRPASPSDMDYEWRAVEAAVAQLASDPSDLGWDMHQYLKSFSMPVRKRHPDLASANATYAVIYRIGMIAETIRTVLRLGGMEENDVPDYNERILARDVDVGTDFPTSGRCPIAKLGDATVRALAAQGVTMAPLKPTEYRRELTTSHTTVLASLMDERHSPIAFVAGRGTDRRKMDAKPSEETIGTKVVRLTKGPLTNDFVIHRIGIGTSFTRKKLAVHLAKELFQVSQDRSMALKLELR